MSGDAGDHIGRADHHRFLAADKLHNARSLLLDLRSHGDGVWSRFKGGKVGTLWYYRAVTKVLCERLGGPVVAELVGCVDALEAIAGIGSDVKPGGPGEP